MKVHGILVLAWLACLVPVIGEPMQDDAVEAILKVLNKIIVPVVDFEGVSAAEAFDFVCQRSIECDPEPNPAMRGVSLLFQPRNRKPPENGAALPANPPLVDFKARNIRYPDLLGELAWRYQLDIWLTDVGIVVVAPGDAPFPNAKAKEGAARKLASADGRERMIREEKVDFRGTTFRVVRVDSGRLSVVWQGSDGTPLRSFDRVYQELTKAGKRVRFLTNAGIFQSDGVPCGLHVQEGKTLHPLNENSGEGNFYLQPNGVFAVFGSGAKARAFLGDRPAWQTRLREKQAETPLELAVQSGPLLLLDGVPHPAFREGSPNRLHRNGVGVDDRNRVVFAITAPGQVVNFRDFSDIFLHLGCRNALFLDGILSQMVVEPKQVPPSKCFGAIFTVAE